MGIGFQSFNLSIEQVLPFHRYLSIFFPCQLFLLIAQHAEEHPVQTPAQHVLLQLLGLFIIPIFIPDRI